MPSLVSVEMQNKWQAQQDKLNEAIQSSNIKNVEQLVSGSIRGYEALEKEAERLGHKPHSPEVWEVMHPESKRKYIIAKTTSQARQATKPGYVTYSLPEVVRILEGQQLVNKLKETFPGAEVNNVKEREDFEDVMPF